MRYPASIQRVIELLTKWPSVGPKTAERYALHLLRQPQDYLNQLSQAIVDLKRGLTVCKDCCRISDSSPCSICSDQKRDQKVLCIIAETKDLLAIENTNQYHGLYHVLGGVMSTINNTNPGDLNIRRLLERVKSGQIQEIILALNPDLEGETTCMYLNRILAGTNARITRLARGLPTGAALEYADELTLSHAFQYRREFRNN